MADGAVAIVTAEPVARSRARVRRLGLHTQREPVVVMRTDCPVCRAEGLSPRSQVVLRSGDRRVTAILFQEERGGLRSGEIGLSEAAWNLLGAREGEAVEISHAPPLESMGLVRSRIYGESLDQAKMELHTLRRQPPQQRATSTALATTQTRLPAA